MAGAARSRGRLLAAFVLISTSLVVPHETATAASVQSLGAALGFPPGTSAIASDAAMLDDGSAIVDIGIISPSTPHDIANAVLKLQPNGQVDTSFGSTEPTPGVVMIPPEGPADLAIDSAGRILIGAGTFVTRLLPDGARDVAFTESCLAACTVNGEPPPPAAPPASVYAPSSVTNIEVLPDDSVIIGSGSPGMSPWNSIIHVDSRGSRDRTFNAGGSQPGVVSIPRFGRAWAEVGPGGGLMLIPSSPPLTLYSFTAHGQVDAGFGGGTGQVSLPSLSSEDSIYGVLRFGSGRLLLLVMSWISPFHPRLYSVDFNGNLDTTFGDNGILDLEPFGGKNPQIYMTADARPVLRVMTDGYQTVMVAMLTPNGHLDASFGDTGATPGWLPLIPAMVPGLPRVVGTLAFSRGQLLIIGALMSDPSNASAAVVESARYSLSPAPPVPLPPYVPSNGTTFTASTPAVATREAKRLGPVAAP